MKSPEPVYKIAKWQETYERAESRKLKQLTWVSVPIGLNSSGYQALLDEFESDAPAIYGAWIALVSVAASCNVRGLLGDSQGNPLKLSHIVRVTGFEASLFVRLFAWASSPQVGWLEIVQKPIAEPQAPETQQKACESSISGESPDEPPTHQGNSPTTRENKTGQDKTTLSLTESQSENEFGPLMTDPQNQEFQTAWEKWKRHLAEQHKPLSQTTEEFQLMDLSRRFPDIEDRILVINFSIGRQAKNLITNGDHDRKRSEKIKPFNSKRQQSVDEMLMAMPKGQL